MDKLEALEIIWKMLPVDATDLQKQAWQTVKRIVHTPQANNSAMVKRPGFCIRCDTVGIWKDCALTHGYACRQRAPVAQQADHKICTCTVIENVDYGRKAVIQINRSCPTHGVQTS